MDTTFQCAPAAPHAASDAPCTVPAALAVNETERLRALAGYGVLDTEAEQAYDDLTMLASAACNAPIALISLVDADRQWFKARVGLEASETPRDVAFCSHAILKPDETFEVADAALDARFAGNPLVTGEPHIRFYAGAPLVTADGLAIGTVCVLDRAPRRLNDGERRALESLARQVVAQLELRRTVADLEHQSMTDGLTSLYNRRFFDRRLREEWMRHARTGRPFALLMLDLDHFKRINDGFGHPAGDAVLVQTAQVLQTGVRLSDVVTRFGGEEFAVILPDTGADAALGVAEKLRAALEATAWSHGRVTASIGVAAVVPTPGGTPNALVAQADRALYRAKEQGRNRTQCFGSW